MLCSFENSDFYKLFKVGIESGVEELSKQGEFSF